MQFIDLRPGKTVEKCPINSFKTDLSSDSYIYILAGIHGDDLSGVYVLHQLFNYIKASNIDLPLIIIPILNVDGHRFSTQKNSHGVNLYSDFITDENSDYKTPLDEPEMKYFIKLLDKYPPALTILFHPVENIQYIGSNKDAILKFFKQVEFRDENQLNFKEFGLPAFLNYKFKSSILSINCPGPKKESTLQNIWDHLKKDLISFLESNEIKSFIINQDNNQENEIDSNTSSHQFPEEVISNDRSIV